MASLCGNPIIKPTTVSALTTPYTPSPVGTNTLINAMSQAGIRAGTAALADTDVKNIITFLGPAYYPTTPGSSSNNTDINKYMDTDNKFVNNVKAEYCYYFNLYANGITQLLDSVSSPSNVDNQGNAFASLNAACKTLNVHLNNIARFVQAIAIQRKSTLNGISTNLSNLSSNLSNASTALAKQQAVLSKEKVNIQLYKEMEEYSREKSQHTNNLLMFYSFLNITALGLLFYIYRSAGSS